MSGRQIARFFKATDEDYLVRHYVARLPVGRLFRMVRDPEREVRRTVAARLPVESLPLMLYDDAPEVRQQVAERIDPAALEPLLRDADWRVRLDEDVRACARERLE